MKGLVQLLSRFDPVTGEIAGVATTNRYLSDLRGCFFDTAAYETALRAGNPLVYSVASAEFGGGEGDLAYGLGKIMPGRIGSEYYLTKGHFHAWREAAELYVGLTGEGMMLLEEEGGGNARVVPLRPYQTVYVPGHTAHRTINTGSVPLTYLGVYPARAGHDYAALARSNFRKVLVDRGGRPVLLDRSEVERS